MLFATFFQRIERNHQIVGIGAHALGFDHHHAAELGKLLTDFEHLIHLFLIFADDDFSIGMLEHIRHFVGGAGRIDPDRHRRDQTGAELGQYPFDPVFRQHGYMTVFRKTKGAITVPHIAGSLEIVAPAHRVPDPKVLLADRSLVRHMPRMLAQHLGKRQFGQVRFTHSMLTIASAYGAYSV